LFLLSDINLDFEYGYDYEKIIKNRLKAVNEAFNNDSTPVVKANTRISFDNTVSAINEQVMDNNNDNRPTKKLLTFDETEQDEIVESSDLDLGESVSILLFFLLTQRFGTADLLLVDKESCRSVIN
jgi:hypothetical protein